MFIVAPVQDSSKRSPSEHETELPPGEGRRQFVRGMVTSATSIQGWVLFATFLGFGGLIRDLGFPLGAALLSTLLIWAMPAQVLLVGGWAAGNPAPVIALAVGLSSVRMFPMTASLMPYLRPKRGGVFVQLLAAHFVAVTAWVEGLRRLPHMHSGRRVPFFFGLGMTLVVLSGFSTVVGFYLAGSLPHALATGLLFLTPISFLLQMSLNARDIVDKAALIFGLGFAPFFAVVGGRFDMLWTGLAGGSAAWLLHRFLRRRKQT